MKTTSTHHTFSKRLIWLATGAAAVGVGVGAAGVASAATGSSGSTGSSAPVAAPQPGANLPDPSTLSHGPGETLLTGTDLAKVTAAAQAADPGATIIRAETDSSGHAFEVHVKNADGSIETLYFTSTYSADGTASGFGGGPGGQPPVGAPQGQPPAAQAPAPQAPSTTGSGANA
jgi:hypothetical protein